MIGVRGGLQKNKLDFGRCIIIEIIFFIFFMNIILFVSDLQYRKSFNNKILKGLCFRFYLYILVIKQ